MILKTKLLYNTEKSLTTIQDMFDICEWLTGVIDGPHTSHGVFLRKLDENNSRLWLLDAKRHFLHIVEEYLDPLDTFGRSKWLSKFYTFVSGCF